MKHPKIGIRPTIDGRQGGVRESLEEKTMTLAANVAALISSNLRYTDGTPVECVIADGTIGRVAESAACAEKFEREGVGGTITVTSCWCYGSETMDMDKNTIKGVWGFNATERPGAVYLASVLAAHAQKGLPAFGIYGKDVLDADDMNMPADVKEKLLRFARAAVAAATMRGKSYLQIGSICMGIAGSTINPEFIEEYLGMRVESVDEVEIIRRMTEGIYDEEEFQKALKWTKEKCKEGFDKNPENIRHTPEQKEKEWEFVVKMTLICRDIMLGNDKLNDVRPVGAEAEHSGPKDGWHEEALGRNAILGGFQGQRQWTDFMPNGDFTEAMLNTTFDWNGKKEPLTFATENDGLNGLSMLLGKLVTGRASLFADVRTYWSPDAVERVCGMRPEGVAKDGFIHLINSGAAALDATGVCKDKDGNAVMKEWWNVTDEDIDAMLKATDWCPADLGYFRGGGYSSHFKTQAVMPMTMIRVNIIKGLGPVLQIAEGYTATLPDEIHNKLDMRTDPTWPTTWFAPRLTGKGAFKDVYSVMANWGANHGAISYGHIGADIITMASMLRIPVAMHNVPEEKIFRPACWGAFGTKDLEGADFRACENYGPLYK